MLRMKSLLGFAALAATITCSTVKPASADEYLWGFSGPSGTQTLTLTLSDSSVLVFDTATSQFTAGVDNQGWWSDTFVNGDTNDNYFAGMFTFGPHELRNFFTFDLAGLSSTATVVSAMLSLTKYEAHSDLAAATLDYSLWDVETDAATLNMNSGVSAAIFGDLGTGKHYGSHTIGVLNGFVDPSVLHLGLNAAAIADIQAHAGGFFSIGGRLGAPTASPVPEFGSVAGFGSFLLLGGSALIRRRNRK